MYTIASIQARMGSVRLPGKVLLPLAGHPILEFVRRGCSNADQVDETVIAVGNTPENEAITGWATRNGVEYMFGPEEDLVRRHHTVATEYDADVIVRVGADSPLLPAAEVDRVLAEHIESGVEYTTNLLEGMPVGLIVDVLERDVLEDLRQRGEHHPAKPFRQNPDQYDVLRTGNSDWSMIADVDLEVDTPADYWNIYDAVEAVGLDPLKVGHWLRDQPDRKP